MIAATFITKTLGMIFVGLLDGTAYTLVSLSYRIFLAVSELDLFGGGAAGQEIYDIFTKKIYMILSIIMLFVFTYQLILMIVNPDGDGTKKTTGLLKEMVITIALVVVLPTVFKYMSVFQLHVLHNNTIGAIVLGTAPTSSSEKEYAYGDSIGMTVLMAFYHPQGTGYDTFFDSFGKFRGVEESKQLCQEAGKASSDVCNIWAENLETWYSQLNQHKVWGNFNTITWDSDLWKHIGDDDGNYYMWVISTGCAVLVAWFFISYAIDLGTRAVKLGFLELIAPIPVMLRIVPNMKKSFETWKGEIIKTYLELFIRVAVIFLIVKLCTLVPQFIDIIFKDPMNGVETNDFLLRSITMVILILGLLKFAKEAPELFKSLMDNGGNLFKGLNFKPGARKRIEENEYGMKAISTVTGAGAGVIGNVAKRWKQTDKNDPLWGRVLTAATAAPRGLVSGGRSGWKNNSKTIKGLGNTANAALADAHASEQRAYDSDSHTALRQAFRDTVDSDLTNAESLWPEIKKNYGKNYEDWASKKGANIGAIFSRTKENLNEFKDNLAGITVNLSSESLKSLTEASNALGNIEGLYKEEFKKATENITKAMNDDLKKLASGGIVIKEAYDSKGNKIETTLNNKKQIEEYYKQKLIDAKSEKLTEGKMQAIASQYKETEKRIRNGKMDDAIRSKLDEQIALKAEKAGLKVDGKAIKGLDDLVNFTSSGKFDENNVGDFVRAMEIMEGVKKSMDETKSINDLYEKNKNLAKEADKADKK